MAIIKYIGRTDHTQKYGLSLLSDFYAWANEQSVIGLDVETNVTKSIVERELRTLQFADEEEKIIWVIQWSYLSMNQQFELMKWIARSKAIFIIMTIFEYVTLRKYYCVLNKIWDIFVVEKLLNAGKTTEKGFYSLAGIYSRRFDIQISKALQTSFDDDIITDDKIEYAAYDTLKLGKIRQLQIIEAEDIDKNIGFKSRKGMMKTIWWENEFQKVLGDIEFEGMGFDTNQWIANYLSALPKLKQAEQSLNSITVNSFTKEWLIDNQFYVDKDKYDRIWTSAAKKREVLSWIFPDIEKTSQVELKQYLKDHDPEFPKDLKLSGKAWFDSEYFNTINENSVYSIIKLLLHDKEDVVTQFFEQNFREKMIENQLLIPAGTTTINWSSSAQKLVIFKKINPEIEDTTAETVENNLGTHEVFSVYQDYADADALVTKFGEKYLEHIDSDGRIRTSFDPVLATGRLSCRVPNLLQLPKLQEYRSAFIATPGYKIAGADYSSEEILIIAIMSQDPVWLKAFKDGDDVHSINASLIFGKEWIEATEPNCAFKETRQKCSCKKHKDMRNKSKTISFG